MSHFQIKQYRLPHEGVIPGAAGHKKIVIPRGTIVFCIMYERKFYDYAYLDEHVAEECRKRLEATVDGTARRHFDLETMVAWNFKTRFPMRVARQQGKALDDLEIS